MQEDAERRPWWPWLLGVVLLALVLWALAGLLAPGTEDVQVEQAVPAEG